VKKIFVCGFVFFLFCLVHAQNGRARRTEYINKYSGIAISEMKRSGIPASITLAQGMIESDNGYGLLAREGNNHFGIKCHNTWDGEKFYHDDDAKNECFRKYKSAEESFRDHTDFLTKTKRYAPLFELDPDDYKGWAKGLKKCGYATHPDYDYHLITLIEEEKLYEFDKGVVITRTMPVEVSTSKRAQRFASQPSDEFSVRIGRKIFMRNRVDYIQVKSDDSFEKLCKELDLLRFELKKYNELSDEYVLKAGDILYLQPKRNKAEPGFGYHIVKEGETMHDIAQLYGVKMRSLRKLNRMEAGTEPTVGQKLSLRKKIKKQDE
jgi:hypothetical protein